MRRSPIEVMKAMQRGSDYMRYEASEAARKVWLVADPCDVYIWRDGSATLDMFGYRDDFETPSGMVKCLEEIFELALEGAEDDE